MIFNRSRLKWVAMLAVALVALGVSPAHAKVPVVTGVQVSGSHGKVSVRVAATGQVSYKVSNLSDDQEMKQMLVIDIAPAQLATNVRKVVNVGRGVVERVRVGQFSNEDNIVRLVVDLKASTRYQVKQVAGNRDLLVWVDTASSGAKASTASNGAVSRPSTSSAHHVIGLLPVGVRYSAAAGRPVRIADNTEPKLSPTHTYVIHNPPGRIARVPHHVWHGHIARHPRFHGTHQGYVTLDFVNADLIYVLKILAKEMHMNLVTDQTVKGSVTLSLKDVPASGAFQLILKISGFSYKVIKNTIVVGAPQTLAGIQSDVLGPLRRPSDLGVLVIPLEFAKAQDVAQGIKDAFSDPDVTVKADDQVNLVTVRAPKSMLLSIKEYTQQRDVKPAPQAVQKTEVIPVKYGVLAQVLQIVKALYPQVSYIADDHLNAMIVRGQDSDIQALKAFLATIDVPLQQVMLDIRVVSLNETASKTLGFSIGSSTGNFGVFAGAGGQPVIFTEGFKTPAGSTTPATSSGSLAISPFTRTPFVIGATLSMLISRNDAKVISTPRVMTQSGHEASVMIGDKFPIVYFDPRAGQFQVQYVDIGVKLTVKPTVAADGTVTVDMSPEVSTLQGLINNQYPETGVTTVKTLVHVHDGDTIVVGGLLREIEDYQLQKLPFLGDLPVLGEFFRNTSVQKTKDEVFITLTPKVMP